MENHPMTRLSDTQTTILSAAANHQAGRLLPVPASVKARGATLDRTLATLVRRGFAIEMIAIATDAVWRTDPDGQRIGLRIADEGLIAIGVEPENASECGGGSVRPEQARPSGKLGAILAAVAGPDGASLVELADAAGWQRHTTRAALTRLRQRGFDIRLETSDGRKAYRLAGKAA
jgi:hypothetical protein